MKFAMALHGGAGAVRCLSYDVHCEHMRELAALAAESLSSGSRSLDVVESVVADMEESGLYVAGRGASPGLAGEYELDACIMDGRNRRVGAVAALSGFQSPISVARIVMDRTPHALLVGKGAGDFASSVHASPVPGSEWYTRAAEGESNFAPAATTVSTVGCVALDQFGHLAAATSSAGVFGKMAGRVGDSPLPGSGTWADGDVAVSCTGQGELFIQAAAAAQVSFHLRATGDLRGSVERSLRDTLGESGEGGMIAVCRSGEVAVRFIAEGMKYAFLRPTGEIEVGVFDQPAFPEIL